MILVLVALLAAGQPADSAAMPSAPNPGAPHSHPMMPVGGPPHMPSAAERAQMWNKQFDLADTNHDGSLSRQEFGAAAEKAFAMKEEMIKRLMANRPSRMQSSPQSMPQPSLPQSH